MEFASSFWSQPKIKEIVARRMPLWICCRKKNNSCTLMEFTTSVTQTQTKNPPKKSLHEEYLCVLLFISSNVCKKPIAFINKLYQRRSTFYFSLMYCSAVPYCIFLLFYKNFHPQVFIMVLKCSIWFAQSAVDNSFLYLLYTRKLWLWRKTSVYIESWLDHFIQVFLHCN